MRDGGRIREKIELALDGRQVVSIVLACAVVLGLVFWLGVTVGRDLSAAAPGPERDPIARVDRQAERVEAALTFPERLVEERPAAGVPVPAEVPAAPVVAPAEDPAVAAPPAPAETYTVQAGALPSQSEADAMADALRRKGLSPYVVVAEVPGKGTYYRVRVGRFGSKEEADRYLLDFRRETGMDGFVTQVGR